MTYVPTARDVRRPRAFNADLLGGRVVIEENACMVRLANCWVMSLVEGRLVEQAQTGKEAGRADGR